MMSDEQRVTAVEKAVLSCQIPGTAYRLEQFDAVTIDHDGLNCAVELRLGYPISERGRETLVNDIKTLVGTVDPKLNCCVDINTFIPSSPGVSADKSLANIKNIIAVASGKGGVGKSTVATNLALTAAKMGARTGLLDADIYGPSIGLMLGVADDVRPGVKETDGGQLFVPVQAHGLETMSMAYLVNEKTPMAWRGPMATGALLQLILQTDWQSLDYLFVDMPPGTGDIQLTMAQRVPVSGSVIVTTPQDLALLDARKGIEMFSKVSVPVLGVIENMATHTCSVCGHKEAIFGTAGGESLAAQYKVPLLGSLPLSMQVRQNIDDGTPTVLSHFDSEIGLLFQDLAARVTAEIWYSHQSKTVPVFETSET